MQPRGVRAGMLQPAVQGGRVHACMWAGMPAHMGGWWMAPVMLRAQHGAAYRRVQLLQVHAASELLRMHPAYRVTSTPLSVAISDMSPMRYMWSACPHRHKLQMGGMRTKQITLPDYMRWPRMDPAWHKSQRTPSRSCLYA